MSALAVTSPIRRASTAPSIAPLEIVATRPQRRARPRAAHAVVMVLGVFGILLTQLLLSISLSDGAYRITSLEAQRAELSRSEQVLTETLDTLRSPQHLAMNAESLGMVANSSPAYLRLSDGRVLGAPVAAGAGSGLFDGTTATIGNVLLAEVPLASHSSEAAEATTMGVAAPPVVPATVASPPGAIPSPVTR